MQTAALTPASQVRIGRRTFPFTSFEHVSATYVKATGVADVGARDAPPCEILDSTGRVVGHVSYNGRVWNHLPDGSTDYSACLYDPVGGFGDWRDPQDNPAYYASPEAFARSVAARRLAA